MLGEETIVSRPVVKLSTGSRQKTSDGVAAQAKQTAQDEGLGAVGEALLGEVWGAFEAELLDGGEDGERFFFRREGGGWRRRRARRLLSSTDHSTVSPREKSMA